MTPHTYEPATKPKRNVSTILVGILLFGVGACCIGMILLTAIFYPVYARARQNRARNEGVRRMNILARANLQYASDFDDRLPIANHWMDLVSGYVAEKRAFRSPGLPPLARGPGVAFMKSLSSAKIITINNPSTAVLLFDSTLMNRNAASGFESEPKPPRFGPGENGGNIFGFLDGHAKLLTAAEEAGLK